MTLRRDPRDARPPRRPGSPRPTRRLGVSAAVAPTLAAVGLALVGAISLSLLGGSIPFFGRGGDGGGGGPIRTPTPSDVVVVDPRAAVPGLIAYVKEGNIWIQEGDHAAQLTTGGADSTPSFSGDGRFVYFVREESQVGKWRASGIVRTYRLAVPSIMRVPTDGSAPPETIFTGKVTSGSLTWHMFIRQPRLSPDGKTIAIMTDGPDPTVSDVDLKFLDLATRKIRDPHLSETPPLGHQDPAWSPDGTSILYVKDARDLARGTPAIYRYDLKKGTVAITGPGYLQPSWDPFGQYIAATRTSSIGTDISILDVKTGAEVLRVTSDEHSFAPAWSPAGDAIAFLRVEGGVVDLELARLSGAAGAWVVADTLRMTVAAGLDATSGVAWFIPPELIPTPVPTIAPTIAPTPAPTLAPAAS